jgi:hypothetical protein
MDYGGRPHIRKMSSHFNRNKHDTIKPRNSLPTVYPPTIMRNLPNDLIRKVIRQADGGLSTHKEKFKSVLDDIEGGYGDPSDWWIELELDGNRGFHRAPKVVVMDDINLMDEVMVWRVEGDVVRENSGNHVRIGKWLHGKIVFTYTIDALCHIEDVTGDTHNSQSAQPYLRILMNK